MKDFSEADHGKRLKIEFLDGEVCEVEVDWVFHQSEHTDCCGIAYNVLSSNQLEKYKRFSDRGSVIPTQWNRVDAVKDFEILENGQR